MYQNDHIFLSPASFFVIRADCHRLAENLSFSKGGRYLLPNTSPLCGEEHFADVLIGWDPEGIGIEVNVHKPFEDCFYPELDKGDSAEIFIDTRDVKTSGFNTRFCHHFYFLPQPIGDHASGEITRFRTEDSHPLCDPKDLEVNSDLKKKSYQLKIFIPSQCLYGYDPEQFNRIGFSYKINRTGGPSQHFSAVSKDFQVDQHPSLWSSLHLVP